MMIKVGLILFLGLLWLAGCAAASQPEPAAVDMAVSTTTLPPALVTVELRPEEATAVVTVEVLPTEASVVQVVPPAATVALSQVTPAAAEGGELIVQPMPGVPDPLADLARRASQDLAQRLNIDVGQVTLVRVVAANWRDSSLGCPQPGMAYLMVITPGYQIVLEAQGRDYYYHTRRTADFVFCEDGKPVDDTMALPGGDE